MDIVLRVYGDSLGLPRPLEGVSPFENYPQLLQQKLEADGNRVALYNRSIGGVSLKELSSSWKRDQQYFGREPAIVVLQCGVVDCAPRPLNRIMRKIVASMPARGREPIVAYLHRNRAAIQKRGFSWRLTEPPVFEKIYAQWLKDIAAAASIVFVINIAPITSQIATHSPGFRESILLYNQIISRSVRTAPENVSLIDSHQAIVSEPGGIAEHITACDGHHLTRSGHELYAKLIFQQARDIFSPEKSIGRAG